MPERPAPLALILDFGGVLTTPTVPATRAWCASVGISYRQFVGPLIADGPGGSLIDRLECGRLEIAEFERLLGAAITEHVGRVVDVVGFVRDVVGAAQLDEAMLDLVDAARSRGLRTGMLSNSWGNDYPRAVLDPHFDDVLISGEVALRKPDPRIYRLAASRLGVPESACVFVDDIATNVTAAGAVGMTGILHVDAAGTARDLAALLPT